MKKYSIHICSFLFIQNSFANPEIIITNQSSNKIKLGYNFIKHSEHLFSAFREISPQENFYGSTKRFTINNNYLLQFTDTHKPCAWLSILGLTYPHGWGIELQINMEKVVTICANKYSILDLSNHAELIYVKTNSGEEKFIYKNLGWWTQNTIYPTELEINLDPIKKDYDDDELNLFIYVGTNDITTFQVKYFSTIKNYN